MVEPATTSLGVIPGISEAQSRQIVETCLRYPGVTRVRLFGSRATGDFRRYSDIDLAIDGPMTDRDTARLAEQLDSLPTPYQFDVVAVNLIDNANLLRSLEEEGFELRVTPFHAQPSTLA